MTNHIFFFQGIPGSGKSMLCSTDMEDELHHMIRQTDEIEMKEDDNANLIPPCPIIILVGDEVKKQVMPSQTPLAAPSFVMHPHLLMALVILAQPRYVQNTVDFAEPRICSLGTSLQHNKHGSWRRAWYRS